MEGSPFSLGGSDIDMSMNSDEDAGAYRHEWFEKDKPDLCVQMKTPKQKSIQSPRLGASPDMMANSTLSLEALLVSPITTEVPEPSLSVTIAATTSTSAVKPAMIMNAIDNAESSSTVTTSSTSDVASDKENDDDVNANGKRKESAMSTTTTPSNNNTAPKKLKTTGPYDANLAPAQYPYGHGH
jgi:hypothetical protein